MLDKVVEKIEDGEALRQEVKQLVPEAGFIADIIDHLPTLRLPYVAMVILVVNLEDNAGNSKLYEEVQQRMQTVYRRLREISRDLGDHPYPLDHADPDMTMRKYVIPTLPDEEDLGELLESTNSVLDQLVTVQYRLFGRLALAAEKVEALFGMDPLPEPEDEDEDD